MKKTQNSQDNTDGEEQSQQTDTPRIQELP